MIDEAYPRDRHVLTHAMSRPVSVLASPATPPKTAATEPRARRPAPVPTFQVRSGYWFPMLLFGILILVAPLVYRPSSLPTGFDPIWHPGGGQMPISGLAFAPLQLFGTCSEAFGDPMSVALYWFCVVMFGPLITLGWYRVGARRLGAVPETGWFLLYALASLLLYVMLYPLIEFVTLALPTGTGTGLDPGTLRFVAVLSVGGFVAGLVIAAVAVAPRRAGRTLSRARWMISGFGLLLAIAAAAGIELTAYLQPRNSYGALLLIGIGLLVLSTVEPGRLCTVIAVAFTSVALAMNLLGASMPADSPPAPGFSPVHLAFTNLLLPAAILITGGLIGGAGRLLARRRGAPRPS
ncbi:MAG TPA: hypothetical protein VF892_22600 [Pseudonocardiaceae bacterium]